MLVNFVPIFTLVRGLCGHLLVSIKTILHRDTYPVKEKVLRRTKYVEENPFHNDDKYHLTDLFGDVHVRFCVCFCVGVCQVKLAYHPQRGCTEVC